MKTHLVSIEESERLDKYLGAMWEVSRSKIQKAIKNGSILVDGEQQPVKFLIEDGMEISYDEAIFAAKPDPVGPLPELDILYEDDEVVVINKRAGTLVHETDTSTEKTLVDALIAHDAGIAEVGDDARRAGLVHRLDKDASGVMIVAKTQEAFDHLKRQFKDRHTTKKYSVLVRGVLSEPHGTIDLHIERSKVHGRMAAKPPSQGGKEAVTHYDIVKQYPHHALLDVHIETGRTHQIRAHMFALGHPVAGDKLYRQKGIKPMDIGRLFLHARELTITLPSGEEQTFIAPLPAELEQVLEDIPKT